MKTLPYPRGAARAIAEARAGGLRPSELVLISLAGRVDWPNPLVYATPGQRFRWDWLKGLSVVVLIESSTRLDNILKDIDGAGPMQLDVVDRERGLGWMVLSTNPRLQTVRWPRYQVEDWLGNQEWHQEINYLKARANLQAETQRNMEKSFMAEAIWN